MNCEPAAGHPRSSPRLVRDLPRALGGDFELVADLSPRVELSVELEGDACPLALECLLDEYLELADARPSLERFAFGEGACDRGVYLVEGFVHDLRVRPLQGNIKPSLDAHPGLWFSLIKRALHGAAHSYQAMPDELNRGRTTTENGPDTATPTSQAGPDQQDLLKGPLMAIADSIGAINRADLLSDADAASTSSSASHLRASTSVSDADAALRASIVTAYYGASDWTGQLAALADAKVYDDAHPGDSLTVELTHGTAWGVAA